MTTRDELADKRLQIEAQDVGQPSGSPIAPTVGPRPELLPPTISQAPPPDPMLANQLPRPVDYTELYVAAETSLFAHLGENSAITPQAIRPIAKIFVDRFADEEPSMLEALRRDANTLRALTDEDLADKIARGEPLAPETGDILDVVADIAYDAGLTPIYEETIAAKESEARAGWNNLVGSNVEQLRTVVEQEARRLAADSDDPNAGLFADQITGDVTWAVTEILDNPTIWTWDGEDGLIFEVTGGAGSQLLGVKLDPGTRVATSMDAIKELILARGGLAHELTSGQEAIVNRPGFISKSLKAIAVAVEESPIARAQADKTINAFRFIQQGPRLSVDIDGQPRSPEDSAFDILQEQPFSMRSVRNEEGRAAVKAELANDLAVTRSIAEAVRTQITYTVAELAWQIRDEGLPDELNPDKLQTAGVDIGSALDAAEELLRTNPEVQDLLLESTTEEVLEASLKQLEDQTVIGEAIEAGVGHVFDALSTWDRVTQSIAVNVLDFGIDTLTTLGIVDPQAIMADWDSDVPLSDGQKALVGMFEETNPFESPEAANVAEYFALDGGQADGALLAAGIVFDPINYIFGGPRFAAALSRRMITNPKYAPLYVKTHGRSLVNALWRREGDDGLRVVASIGGHTPESLRDLVDIARRPKSELTRSQVEEVLLRHLPSTDGVGFITLGGADRARTHLFANALAATIDKIPTLDADTAANVWQSLAKLDKTRTVSLQPSVFIDDFLDTVVTIFPGDQTALARWTERLADTIENSTIGRREWQATAQARLDDAAGRLTSIEDEIADLAGVMEDGVRVGGSISDIDNELRHIRESLARARQAGRGGVADMMNQRRVLESARRERLARKKELFEELGDIKKQVSSAQRELTYAQSAGNNQAQARLVAEFYDEVAKSTVWYDEAGKRHVGLEKIGRDRAFQDLPRYDWSPVTGVKTRDIGVRSVDQQISPLEGLVGEGSELVDDLDELGLFNRQSVASTPVSPYELIIYNKLMDLKDGNVRQRALAAWRDSKVKGKVSQWYGTYRKLFAINLLLNATTPFVTNIDEVMRFWAVSGKLSPTMKALAAPLGPIGDLAAGGVGARAAQYQRDVLGDLIKADSNWTWVKRPPRGRNTQQGQYVDQVERFINGQLMQDDILRQWAQTRATVNYVRPKAGTADDAVAWVGGRKAQKAPEEFRVWWEEGVDGGAPGVANYRDRVITNDGSVTRLSTDEVYARVDNAIRHWLRDFVDEESREQFTEALVEKLATFSQFDRTADASLLKAVRQVPGLEGVQQSGIDRVFDTFYGKPGQRRGAIFYDHFYEEHLETLRAAYRTKGTLLDADTLMGKLGEAGVIIDGTQAEYMLARAFDDPQVATLLRGGFVTDESLRVQAARYAERRADELMYSLASSSLWGQTGEAAFPFLRAQTDFLAWWWRHMTSPAVMRVTPEARGIPGIGAAIRAIERVPLNVRAAAKFSHMAAAVNNNFDSSESFGGVDWSMDTFTFFPLENSGDIMMDIMPTPLGGPSWLALKSIDDTEAIDDTWRTLAEDVWPALQWTTTGSFFTLESLFPASERSLRNVAGVLTRSLAALWNTRGDEAVDPNVGWASSLAAGLTTVRQAAGTTTAQAVQVIDFLRSDQAERLSPDRANSRWLESVMPYIEKGAMEAINRSAGELFKGQVKLSDIYSGDAPYLEGYRSVIDNWALLNGMGILPTNMTLDESGQPRLLRIWEQWEQGDATEADVRFLADSFATLATQQLRDTAMTARLPADDYSVRDYLMTRDRAFAVNSVSKVMVTPNLDLQGGKAAEFARLYGGPDGRLTNIPPGEDGLKIRSEALDKGWIITRPSVDWVEDAHSFSDAATRKSIRAAWELISGKSWGAESVYRRDESGFVLEPGLPIRDSEGNSRRNLVVEPDQFARHLLDISGIDIEERPYTLQELRIVLDERLSELAAGPYAFSNMLSNSQLSRQIERQGGAEGQAMLASMQTAAAGFDKSFGWEEPEDWPEEVREWFRQRFISAVDLGWLSESTYRNTAQSQFGPLDWEPPTPPPRSELQSGWDVNPADIGVSDGDTLVLPMADAALRVRLLGINAPEAGSGDAAILATESLSRAIQQADTVTLGFYKPEVFGVAQTSAPGVQRLVAWLYINGVPVYDENLFTPTNQTGAGIGGEYVDVWSLYERRANE